MAVRANLYHVAGKTDNSPPPQLSTTRTSGPMREEIRLALPLQKQRNSLRLRKSHFQLLAVTQVI
jgi:hypothetical protein